MIVDFSLLADRVSKHEDGKLDIQGAGISHVSAAEVPTTVPALAFVVRLLLEDSDRGVGRQMSFRVRTADGEEIVTSPTFPLSPEATSRRQVGANEQDRAALVMLIELGQFGFPAYGAYEIEMLLDDEVIASKELAVIPGTGTARTVFSTPRRPLYPQDGDPSLGPADG